MTEVYLVRHAKKSNNIIYQNKDENILTIDEKRIISKEGEKQSKILAELPFLQDVDIIFSSHYVRTMQTANYLSEKINKPIIVNKNFGERVRTNNKEIILPNNFRMMQMKDENYKVDGGESRKEVFERFYNELMRIIKKYANKKIVIVSHKTAISMLLMKWCENKITDKLECFYNKKTILNGSWDGTPEIFKLEFDNNELINIDKITYLDINN